MLNTPAGPGPPVRFFGSTTARRTCCPSGARYLLLLSLAEWSSPGAAAIPASNAAHITTPKPTPPSWPTTFPRLNAVMSVTVMEEVNADKMVAELVRVAKPGGRIGVIVRAQDTPWIVNLPLSKAIKQKVEAPGVMGGGVSEGGCADASIYARFHRAGLTQIRMLPQVSSFNRGPNLQNWQTQALSVLAKEEVVQWRAAVAQVESEGTFFIGQPFHCAVGTKP